MASTEDIEEVHGEIREALQMTANDIMKLDADFGEDSPSRLSNDGVIQLRRLLDDHKARLMTSFLARNYDGCLMGCKMLVRRVKAISDNERPNDHPTRCDSHEGADVINWIATLELNFHWLQDNDK